MRTSQDQLRNLISDNLCQYPKRFKNCQNDKINVLGQYKIFFIHNIPYFLHLYVLHTSFPAFLFSSLSIILPLFAKRASFRYLVLPRLEAFSQKESKMGILPLNRDKICVKSNFVIYLRYRGSYTSGHFI